MTDVLRDSVAKIRDLSPKLNAAVQEANAVVQAVEQFLNDECKAGLACAVNVWTRMPDDDPDADSEDFEGMWLAYERVNQKFRIVILENVKDQEPETLRDILTTVKTPWSDSPKSEKLTSFRMLPGLLDAISRKIERSINVTTETSATVTQILDALKMPRAEPTDPARKEHLDEMGQIEEMTARLDRSTRMLRPNHAATN